MKTLPDELIYSKKTHGFDLFKEVFDTQNPIFDQYTASFVNEMALIDIKK